MCSAVPRCFQLKCLVCISLSYLKAAPLSKESTATVRRTALHIHYAPYRNKSMHGNGGVHVGSRETEIGQSRLKPILYAL